MYVVMTYNIHTHLYNIPMERSWYVNFIYFIVYSNTDYNHTCINHGTQAWKLSNHAMI